VTGYVCSLTDTTEAKRAEGRLAVTEDDKGRFLAALAYEIQTRLVPLTDGLELLNESHPRSHRVRTRAIIREQIERARAFAGDLFDVSQIALGQIELRPSRVLLRSLLEVTIAAVRPTLTSTGHKIVVQLPDASLSVIADEARLFQAFALLIRFASEGTPEGGKVAIFYTLTTDSILIHIKDSSRGITMERLASLFDLFTQRETARRGVPPELGLSLFTARRLIELHGGTVEATNIEPARGLLLTARLPLAADSAHRGDRV
jgi:two-component system CheB/CheR fusion protein